MSEWLFKEDNYIPKEDKESFIDKSILALIKMLSNIKREGSKDNLTVIYKINPLVKLIGTILILVLLSLSKSAPFIVVVSIYVTITIAFLHREDSLKIISISFIVPIFTSITLIPSMLMGNLRNSIFIIVKLILGILLFNILSYTTKNSHLTKALKVLFIPDIFILVLEITIRYIYLLGDFSLNLMYSLKLRSIGKNNRKYSSMSQILGVLFLKSKFMGDEMYNAMQCRGFTGEYVSYSKFKFHLVDFIYCAINLVLIIAFIILRG